MTTRREFLTASLAGLGVAATGLPAWARRADARPGKPRKFVHVLLLGGIDSVYWFDPKRRAEVDKRVDLPYSDTDILPADNGLLIAPHAAALARHAGRIAVVNGIQSTTIAHEVGQVQLRYFTRDYLTPTDRSLACEIGDSVGGSPDLHEIQLGRLNGILTRTTGGRSLYVDGPGAMIRRFIELRRADAKLFDHAVDKLRRRARATADRDEKASIAATLALLERLPVEPPLNKQVDASQLPKMDLKTITDTVESFNVAGWLLANDLVPAVSLVMQGTGWDTHTDNHKQQSCSVALLSLALAQLIDDLAAAPGAAGGTLLDETAIVLSSELGRFPFVNLRQGKDHYPVMPVVFIGPGIRAGRYGGTDELLAPKPISATTGAPDPGGAEVEFDDVGATIRRWFGMPQPAAMRGRPMEFLFG